jgi:hypothetical protein
VELSQKFEYGNKFFAENQSQPSKRESLKCA